MFFVVVLSFLNPWQILKQGHVFMGHTVSGQSYTKNQKNLWTGCRKMIKKSYFSHLFHHSGPKKIFSCETAYAIFKVVYQASLITKIRKIYGLVAETCSKTHIFHNFFAIFGPKNFSCKTAYAILKVVYQASHIPKIRKIYCLAAKKC